MGSTKIHLIHVYLAIFIVPVGLFVFASLLDNDAARWLWYALWAIVAPIALIVFWIKTKKSDSELNVRISHILSPGFDRNSLLSRESERNEAIIVTVWLLLAFVINYGAQIQNLQFNECDLCIALEGVFTSVSMLSDGASNPTSMRYTVSFMLLSSPVLFILLLLFASSFRRNDLPPWGHVFFMVLLIFSGYTAYFGVSFGGSDAATLGKLYFKYQPVAIIISGAAFILFASALRVLIFQTILRNNISHTESNYIKGQ